MAKQTDEFFQEEEQKAQEEMEKIKIGDQEYDQKQLEALIEKGRKAEEYAKKYNTDFDKAWSSYGKTTQENKTLKEKLEQLEAQSQRQTVSGDLTDDQIQQAREQARKIGLFTQGDLDTWYQQRRAAERLLDECKGFEGQLTGEDGRPKFDTEEILRHMEETGIKNPMKAYKDKYENELDQWRQKELMKEKGEAMPTMTTVTGTKQPKPVAVTRDNIAQLVRQELWGSEKNE